MNLKIAARVLLTVLASGACLSIGLSLESPSTYARSSQTATYQVVYGPWYIHATSPTIHSQTIGLAQTGDTLSISCHETGDNVDGDAEWDVVTDLNNGLQGVIADKGTSTPVTLGNEALQLTALGIPKCGDNTQTGSSQPNTSETSVFFSPIPNVKNGLSYLPDVGDINYTPSDWVSPVKCSDAKVAQDVMPTTVTTLAGWSLARLGPIYFLAANPDRWNQIHTIILFDPGSTVNFTGGCDTDPRYNINSMLAEWLGSNPANHLVIYTGAVSEEGNPGPYPQPFVEQLQDGTLQQQPYINNETFAGLWKYYLAGIWNQPFASQAQICDYNGMGHEDVLKYFAYTVKNSPNGCPVASDGQQPVAWNP